MKYLLAIIIMFICIGLGYNIVYCLVYMGLTTAQIAIVSSIIIIGVNVLFGSHTAFCKLLKRR